MRYIRNNKIFTILLFIFISSQLIYSKDQNRVGVIYRINNNTDEITGVSYSVKDNFLIGMPYYVIVEKKITVISTFSINESIATFRVFPKFKKNLPFIYKDEVIYKFPERITKKIFFKLFKKYYKIKLQDLSVLNGIILSEGRNYNVLTKHGRVVRIPRKFIKKIKIIKQGE